MLIESVEQQPNKPEQTPGQTALGELSRLVVAIERTKQYIKQNGSVITSKEIVAMRDVVRDLETSVRCVAIVVNRSYISGNSTETPSSDVAIEQEAIPDLPN